MSTPEESPGTRARRLHGQSYKGVVEIGLQGSRAATAAIDGPAHTNLAMVRLGRVQTMDQRRFAFTVMSHRLLVLGSSSLGTKPGVSDIPMIHAALNELGFLQDIDVAIIMIDRVGPHDLLTGKPLRRKAQDNG